MLPLDDVKVVDFMWALAGPGTSRTLADYGATVVRIESASRIDGARTVGPFYKNKPANDGSGLFGTYNAGKLGLGLDLSKPEARDVVLDLVRWADVCVNPSPKAMRAWKLDYESLRVIKPDLIMLSSCLMGQTGPLSAFTGFGTMAAAAWASTISADGPTVPRRTLRRLHRLCCARFGAYRSWPRSTTATHRQGQYMISRRQSPLCIFSPALLDCAANHRVAQGLANDDPNYAPHGVYRALGGAAGWRLRA